MTTLAEDIWARVDEAIDTDPLQLRGIVADLLARVEHAEDAAQLHGERADRWRRERDAIKASVAEAVKLIQGWMTPGAPVFDPGHAGEVEALLKKTIGERTIAALGGGE